MLTSTNTGTEFHSNVVYWLSTYDKKSRAIANILPAQFLIFYETHFNAKN